MDDFVEPTEEKEWAGRMDAADRAARLEDGISHRRQERRLVGAMAAAPAAGAAPDLNQLRELLTAVKNDPMAGLPWWLDSAPGGDDDGPDGTTDVGGIVAGWDRTVHDHTGAAVGTEPAVNELGSINPPLAEALAVAAVNALPWLLAEIERLRAAAPTKTEWTWRHNSYVSEGGATTDRAEAERSVEKVRAANPGHDVGVMTRAVTEWRDVPDEAVGTSPQAEWYRDAHGIDPPAVVSG